jgi:hypothetical protein
MESYARRGIRNPSIPKGNVPNALVAPFRIELTWPKCLVNPLSVHVGPGTQVTGNPNLTGTCDPFAMPGTQFTTSYAGSYLA